MNDRRTFLKSLAAVAAGSAAIDAAPAGARSRRIRVEDAPFQPARAAGGIRKSTLISMLPNDVPYADRFALARECGFEGIEMHTMPNAEEAAEIRDASAKTGLEIHSVMNQDHWRLPLSSDDPEVVNGSVRGMETSLRNAALWGADAVLLVPAVVNEETAYREAWTRSQRVIRERLLPLATELKVIIAVEEVWNKFLLSPLEFARYVDEFESPWVRAYFDVGNVVLFAYPQDWIRTLGPRIEKLHVKDFRLDGRNRRYDWTNIGEGDINWPEVRRALTEINYSGYITTELPRRDAAYLKDLSARLDRFLAGEPPVAKTV